MGADAEASPPPPARAAVPLWVGAVGFQAQVTQIVLLRELLAFFAGLELLIGITLGTWMAFCALGALAGGRLAARRPPGRALPWVLTAAGLLAVLSVVVLRQSRGLLGLVSGQEPSLDAAFLLTALSLSLPALCLGAAFPLAARLLARPGRTGAGTGAAYLFEALGAVAGGALFTFVLVRWLTPLHILFLGASVSLAAAAWAAEGRDDRIRRGVAAALFLALCATGTFLDLASERARWRDFNPRYRFLESRDSRYGRLTALDYQGQVSLFASGHLVYALPDRAGSAALAHLVLVQHPRPARVLLVGGGLAGVAREALRHPVRSLEVVELDGELVDMTLAYMTTGDRAVFDDSRVRVHRGDGRLFIKRAAPGTYDVVLCNLPDPANASLNRFYTEGFFREVRRVLGPGGVAAFTLSSAETYLGAELSRRNGTIYHTFLSAFPHVRVAPGDTAVFLGATDQPALSLDPDVLARRFQARDLAREGAWFTPHHYHLLLEEEDVRRVNRALRAWPREPGGKGEEEAGTRPLPAFLGGPPETAAWPWEEPVPEAPRVLNRDDRPAGSLATLLVWNRRMGQSGLSGVLEGAASLSAPLLALLPVVLLLPVAGLLATGRGPAARRAGIASAVAAVGFAELVFELCVLFAFQSYHGYVYREMGVLFAVFMAGLAAGTWAGTRWLADRPRPAAFAAVLGGSIAACFALPSLLAVLGTLSNPALAFPGFAGLCALAGLPVGLLFPQAAAAFGREEGKSAPALYGADLAGGIAGALVTGAVLLPALGTGATLRVFTAAVLGWAALALLVGWWGTSAPGIPDGS